MDKPTSQEAKSPSKTPIGVFEKETRNPPKSEFVITTTPKGVEILKVKPLSSERNALNVQTSSDESSEPHVLDDSVVENGNSQSSANSKAMNHKRDKNCVFVEKQANSSPSLSEPEMEGLVSLKSPRAIESESEQFQPSKSNGAESSPQRSSFGPQPECLPTQPKSIKETSNSSSDATLSSLENSRTTETNASTTDFKNLQNKEQMSNEEKLKLKLLLSSDSSTR